MFLTTLSLGISVQLLFGLNAPFICIVKVLGAGIWHTHEPNSSNRKHQRVAAETQLSAGAPRDLGHSPPSLLLPFWAAGFVCWGWLCCRLHQEWNSCPHLQISATSMDWNASYVHRGSFALVRPSLCHRGKGKLCTSECLCWHLLLPALITGHQLVPKCLLMFCFSEKSFQEKQEKMPGSGPLTLVMAFCTGVVVKRSPLQVKPLAALNLPFCLL